MDTKLGHDPMNSLEVRWDGNNKKGDGQDRSKNKFLSHIRIDLRNLRPKFDLNQSNTIEKVYSGDSIQLA